MHGGEHTGEGNGVNGGRVNRIVKNLISNLGVSNLVETLTPLKLEKLNPIPPR